MATTGFWPVKGQLKQVLDYADNPEKTASKTAGDDLLQTLRYTAMVKADNKVKDGEAVIRITVFQGNAELSSQRKTFTLRTSR